MSHSQPNRVLSICAPLALSALWCAPATSAQSERRAVEPSPAAPAEAETQTTTLDFVASGDGTWLARRVQRDFECSISRTGARFVPAAESDVERWSLALATAELGREAALRALPWGEVACEDSSVVLTRGASVAEWFVHVERGVEQGWTLAEPPAGGAGDLIVRVALATDLTPRLAADGQAIFFHDALGKPVLRYGELAAFDATGRELEASLALSLGSIDVRVDDSGAVYPLEIDPLVSPAAWTADSDQAGAFFGYGISTAGDVNGDGFSDLVVGAPRFDSNTLTDNGSVHVFYGSASGLSAAPDWSAFGTQGGAQFGVSVSTAGDVDGDGYDDFVVGEFLFDGDLTDEGRAHLYLGSASGPVAAAWAPEGNQASCQFAYSVAWAGDVNGDGLDDVLVGAPFYDAGSTDEGRAFLYLGTPSGLSPSPVWIEESDQTSAQFGFTLATAGDTNADGYDDVIVGAPYYNGGATDSGAIGVYLGGPFGPAAAPVYWGTVSQASVRTGFSVGPAGDVNGDGYADVMFGGPWYDNGQTDEGLVWVKTGSSAGITGAGWSEEGGAASIGWGYSASTAGDVNGDGFADIVASAVYWENSGSTADEGAVWLYLGSTTGLPAGAQQLVGEGNQASAFFGHRVGAAGDVNGDGYSDVFVATGYFNDPEVDEGKVWVHYGYANGVQSATPWVVESNFTNARYGESVEMAGDVDGDGFDDLLVASGGYPNVFANGGRVYMYRGKAGGVATSASWFVDAVQANEMLGANQGLAAAGDVDGDGYADVIVGSMGFDGAFADAGRARLYRGGPSGLAASPAWTFEGSAAGQLVGGAVAGIGDVDGDGYGDVLVAAEGFGGGVGRVYLFKGSLNGLAASPSATFDSPHATSSTPPAFGTNVAGAGDVDGDGLSDFVVTAPHNGSGQRVYLYRGSRQTILVVPAWTYENSEWGLQPQWTIAGAGVGDVNGDGFGDVAIGAELEDFQAGHAYLFLGSASGLATNAAWEATGASNARLGRSLASAGDLNADGFPDFAVGAPYETSDQASEGVLHVRYGSAATPGASGSTRQSSLANAGFGWSCAGDGDLDGDGYSDLAVGSPLADNPSVDEGRAYVSYGNDGRSRARRLQQRRRDDLAPIAVLGGTDTTQFRAAVQAFSPAGRADVALEWEVELATEPYDGAGIDRSAFATNTGVPFGGVSSVSLSEVVGGVTTLALRDWRARVTSRNPLFPRSPWFSLPRASAGEGALRGMRRVIGYLPR